MHPGGAGGCLVGPICRKHCSHSKHVASLHVPKALPLSVHWIQKSNNVLMSSWQIQKSEGRKHCLTDLALELQPAWHLRAERWHSISESVFCVIKTWTHCFDLPKDRGFMKINAVFELESLQNTVYSESTYFSCIFLGWNKQTCTTHLLPPHFLYFWTPTLAWSRIQTSRKTVLWGKELQPKALAVPDSAKFNC